MKKVLVWETAATVAGGQRMTLTVMDLLKEDFEFHCLIPAEGPLSEELKKRNISYTLMGDQTLPAGVKGKKVYFKYAWLSVKNIIRSLGAIRRVRPELLYAPGPASLPWSAVCGNLTGKPVIWHLHHMFADGPTKKLLDLTARFRSVKKIVAVSDVVGHQITNPKAHQKAQTIYNPVDVARYASGDPSKVRTEVEQALGCDTENRLVLLQTAVLRKTKYQDLFVRVIEVLKNRQIPVTAIIVGEALTEDDRAFKAGLLQQIADCGLTKDIYMAGFRKNVQDFLAVADLVFVPSDVEGLSLAAQEAMCARRDIIATEVGGVGELLRVADCGNLYAGDAAAGQIADIIMEARNTDRQDKLDNGYAFCLSHTREAYQNDIRNVFLAVRKD